MTEYSLLLPRSLPPNGYGLYGMSGGVWEWTFDRYDACYYTKSPRRNPSGPTVSAGSRIAALLGAGEPVQRVLRGGSWADAAGAVTVSFRMSRAASSWRGKQFFTHFYPNIGFRLVRRRTRKARTAHVTAGGADRGELL